jgi:Uri superfamily endonuclease
MTALTMPDALLQDLADAGLDGHWYSGATKIPDQKGAYALLIGLDAPLVPSRPSGNTESLGPGWYIYAGSARGTGGLAARLKRHFRKRKKMKWHIDRLTPHAAAIAAHILPDGDECDLVDRLAASFAFDVALPGFGSSDCPICPSHLLVWRPPEERPV